MKMIIVKTIGRLLLAYAVLATSAMLMWSNWGGPPNWTAVAPLWITLVLILLPSSLIRKSQVATIILSAWFVCFAGVMLWHREVATCLSGILLLLGLLAKPALIIIASRQGKGTSNHTPAGICQPADALPKPSV